MEVSLVRKRLKAAMEAARQQAQRHRLQVAAAEHAYDGFLTDVATPVARQLANALKAEGYSFSVFTPGGGLRLASDTGRDDFVELTLDSTSDDPQVLGRISYSRGSRTRDEERPLKPGVAPDSLTEEDVLEFLLQALQPWLER